MSIRIDRPTMTPKQEAMLNTCVADTERNAGLIDYVAMMADVELPEEDEEGDTDE